jgi:hypothetical protein
MMNIWSMGVFMLNCLMLVRMRRRESGRDLFSGMGDRPILSWHVYFCLLWYKIQRNQREHDSRRDEETIPLICSITKIFENEVRIWQRKTVFKKEYTIFLPFNGSPHGK